MYNQGKIHSFFILGALENRRNIVCASLSHLSLYPAHMRERVIVNMKQFFLFVLRHTGKIEMSKKKLRKDEGERSKCKELKSLNSSKKKNVCERILQLALYIFIDSLHICAAFFFARSP
jgi:hypothetical protein